MNPTTHALNRPMSVTREAIARSYVRQAPLTHSRIRDSRRAAFTLLEILVATLLSATLLALLWGTFNMYLRMFESGERATHEAQLLLALGRQFSESIQAVPALEPPPPATSEISFSALPAPLTDDPLFDDVPPDEAGPGELDLPEALADPIADLRSFDDELANGEASISEFGDSLQRGGDEALPLPKFGIVGSYNWVTLFGVQLVPEPPPSGETVRQTPGLLESDLPPGANALRVIHFRYLQPSLSPNRLSEAASGLLRVESAWHEGNAHEWSDDDFDEYLTTLAMEREGAIEAVDQQIARVRQQREGRTALAPEQVMLVSDVAGLKFRYYDGFTWKDTWDSRLEKRLPLAIEIFVQFHEPMTSGRRAARRGAEQGGARGEGNASDVSSLGASGDSESLGSDSPWNTLELYDPDDLTWEPGLDAPSTPIHRMLIPCAGGASDALRQPRTGGTDSLPDGTRGEGELRFPSSLREEPLL